MTSLITILRAAWSRANTHDISLMAAGIAFYAFLSLVPLLAVVVLSYGFFADPQTVSRHVSLLYDNLPPSAAELISGQIENVVETRGSTKGLAIIVALALSLFSARGAAVAIIDALNRAFEAKDQRNFLYKTLVALALTLSAIAGLGMAAGAMSLVGILGGTLATIAGLFVLILTGFLGALGLYRFAPAGKASRYAGLRVGAGVFTVLWLIASAGFSFYAANFGSYGATYGALSSVIVLLTWLYLSAFLLLFGSHVAAANGRNQA